MKLAIATIVLGMTTSCFAQEIEVPQASPYWDRVFISAEPSDGGNVSGAEYLFYYGIGTTLTAVANRGYAFSSWTQDGNIVSSDSIYRIFVEWDLLPHPPGVLHYVANFVAVEYIPENARYAGLFISSDEPSHTNSGLIAVSSTATGGYSAKIWLNGAPYSGSGRFSSNGVASFSVLASDGQQISVSLQAQLPYASFLAGEVRVDSLTNGWTAELIAYRRRFNAKTHPALNAGRYTLLIPNTGAPLSAPSGSGFGIVRVDRSGNLVFVGTLGDGTKVTQNVFVSQEGLWPLYASSHSGGSILGWITFTNLPNSDFSGIVNWRQDPKKAKLYPDGFTLECNVVGSSYDFRVGATALNLTNDIIVLENGSLSQSITNELLLHKNNTITGTNGVDLRVVATSGLLSGTMTDPVGNKISIRGILFQKQNFASGFFFSTNQSGTIYIGPEAN